MGDKIFLTKQWLIKLETELKFLKENKRVEIAKKLKEAISFWDLSENAEYEDARNEQSQVELRIVEIEEQLKNVEIIEETKNKWTQVNIWSIVTILDINENEEFTYKIVGSTEANILDEEKPKISNESPIWKAILWKKPGETVSVQSPGGKIDIKITKIA